MLTESTTGVYMTLLINLFPTDFSKRKGVDLINNKYFS
jgi:hypothetical protein